VSLTIAPTFIVPNFFALFGTIFFMTLYVSTFRTSRIQPDGAGVPPLPPDLHVMVTAPVSGSSP